MHFARVKPLIRSYAVGWGVVGSLLLAAWFGAACVGYLHELSGAEFNAFFVIHAVAALFTFQPSLPRGYWQPVVLPTKPRRRLACTALGALSCWSLSSCRYRS